MTLSLRKISPFSSFSNNSWLKSASLFFILAALLIVILPAAPPAAPSGRTIRVEAGGYAFTPGVVRVNPGDRVTLELVSKDVAHGLSIDGYAVDLQAEPGQPARVTFIAGRAGSFKLRCSMPCGNLHPFMTGKFVVGPNLLLLRAGGLALLAVIFGFWKTLHG